jgi:hypothetical protein
MTEGQAIDADRVLRLTRAEYEVLSSSLRAEADIIIVAGVVVKNRHGHVLEDANEES